MIPQRLHAALCGIAHSAADRTRGRSRPLV